MEEKDFCEARLEALAIEKDRDGGAGRTGSSPDLEEELVVEDFSVSENERILFIDPIIYITRRLTKDVGV